jgi:hypothetical protein
MVKPKHFNYNKETANNNHFQKEEKILNKNEILLKAIVEFEKMVEIIRKEKIEIHVFNDRDNIKTTDSIFPNNWITLHEDGTVIIYPMFSKNRRKEKRKDLTEKLKNKGYNISKIIDLSSYEKKKQYLEGTGSMILDRSNKICYAALSKRTNEIVLNQLCKRINYKLLKFKAYQSYKSKRKLIYHTNVMMCLADEYAIICLESIDDENEKKLLIKSLNNTKKQIIEISEEQCKSFVGNMLQVKNKKNDKYLIMSETAHKSLNLSQKKSLEKYNKLLYSNIKLIEKIGGGGARCMIAENFLQKE